jgi:UDP-N-acetylmuramate dehydrogenase
MLRAIPLAPFCTYRVGGPAGYYVKPANGRELQAALALLRTLTADIFVLAGGSKLLVADGGYPGAVIHLAENFAGLEFRGEECRVRAGTPLSQMVWASIRAGRRGLQRLAGIPGTTGGAVYMNAGAFESCISDHLAWVETLDYEGREIRYTRKELEFGYRSSPFQTRREIIHGLGFKFPQGDSGTLAQEAAGILAGRMEKQPLQFPNCGSVFKRPPGGYAGTLVEKAGLKGRARGGAQISEKHGNFILNMGGATAADILWLMRLAQEQVLERFGVRLELEAQLVGY